MVLRDVTQKGLFSYAKANCLFVDVYRPCMIKLLDEDKELSSMKSYKELFIFRNSLHMFKISFSSPVAKNLILRTSSEMGSKSTNHNLSTNP